MGEGFTIAAAIIFLAAVCFYGYVKYILIPRRRRKAGYEDDDEPSGFMVYLIVGLIIVAITIIAYFLYFREGA